MEDLVYVPGEVRRSHCKPAILNKLHACEPGLHFSPKFSSDINKKDSNGSVLYDANYKKITSNY